MIQSVLAWLLTVACLINAGAPPGFAAPQTGAASPNDTARFLAGLPPAPGSPLEALANEPGWQKYAKQFETEWAALETRQLSKVRAWSAKTLGPSKPTLYYMFSGPDFLYAHSMFPTASTYVLSGLEPIGRVPDILSVPRGGVPTVLGNLRASLSDVLSRSYFITSHMEQKLRRGQLAGVLPVLYVFLARTGNTIEEVGYLSLQPDGSVKPFDGTTPATTPKAVKIGFKSREGTPQTLYFFSTNVANKAVAESGFLKFCAALGAGDALIKSASYLPHGGPFSSVRELIMKQAQRIVQDDTGVPLRLYKEGEWKVEPFGIYTRPIPPFTYAYQPLMRKLYDKHKPAPLDFSYGYRWRQNQSNVVLATKIAR